MTRGGTGEGTASKGEVTIFTEEEISFLRSQSISVTDVYDGRRQSKSEREVFAKRERKLFVLAGPCRSGGHRLRTRAGHCIQCDTRKIAYIRRHELPGFIYIAGSKRGRVVKIGTAVDIEQRERNLNHHMYGGLNDWRIIFWVEVESGSGRIEKSALAKVAEFAVNKAYQKDGATQIAAEILRCSYSTAFSAVKLALKGKRYQHPLRLPTFVEYEFKH
jgi:hypothetical protein